MRTVIAAWRSSDRSAAAAIAVAVVLWIALALALANPVWADEPPATVSGRVIDVLGRPLADASVHAVSSAGAPARAVKTGKDGRYRLELPGGGTYSIVFALRGASAQRSVSVEPGAAAIADGELELGEGEVITIRDLSPPPVLPRPRQDPRVLPKYSDEAILADAWTKAWLLLDVSATGEVTRLKLLKRPGYKLDNIAIRQGFALTFEPGRDAGNRPVRTLIVWALEWPSKTWLQEHHTALRAPRYHIDPLAPSEPAIEKVPCAGGGEPWRFSTLWQSALYQRYRDCSQPDLDRADALPWISRRKR